MKVFITGVAGTGKSTISKALNEKGITSIDFSDNPGFQYWRNKITKEKVKYIPTDDVNWFYQNESLCDFDKLQELLNKYKDLVVTGVATGTGHLKLFDRVLLLQCEPQTLISRMETRERMFGKTKAEQDHVLEWQKKFDPELISFGAIPVNTEGTLDTVVDKIMFLL